MKSVVPAGIVTVPLAAAGTANVNVPELAPLIFNAVAKIPMQAFILFIGAMVFVFYLFAQPPLLFQRAELQRIQSRAEYPALASDYSRAFDRRKKVGRPKKPRNIIDKKSAQREKAI